MKTIGLLGGMSWVSTEHYYRGINERAAARLGGDSCASLVLWQSDFARITAHQRAGKWDAAGEILAGGAQALVRAGAQAVVLACTEHSLVLSPTDVGVMILDSAEIHINAVVAAAFA